jgi:hypothetical protein
MLDLTKQSISESSISTSLYLISLQHINLTKHFKVYNPISAKAASSSWFTLMQTEQKLEQIQGSDKNTRVSASFGSPST